MTLLTIDTYSLTFSLRQGARPLTHFLVNYTLNSGTPSQLIVAIDDPAQVIFMVETDSRGIDSEYQVKLRVSGLRQSGGCEFTVAGRSLLGDGEFSDWARFENKGEHHLLTACTLCLPVASS